MTAQTQPVDDLAHALREVGDSPVPRPDACLNLARIYQRSGDAVRAMRWAFAALDADSFTVWLSATRVWKKAAPLTDPPPRTARVAVIGSYTTSQFSGALEVAAARAGVGIELYEAGYAQYRLEVLDASSALHRFRPDVVVIAVSESEVALPDRTDDPEAAVEEELGRWTSLWDEVGRLGARVIQHNFAVPVELALGHLATKIPGSRYAMVHRLNARLGEAAGDRVAVVDCERLSALAGKGVWFDPRYFFRAKQAVGLNAIPLLARHTAAVLAARLGASKKCLVLDLDNTLWGGVLGEEGIGGIALGHGPVGEAYSAFQRYILQLKDKGVILAVCSKNNEADVRQVFEEHPDMLIRLDDIALLAAGWEDKPTVVRSIATTLGIGLDSMVFVDDNPVEREAVRELVPGVDVIALPAEPAHYVSVLAAYPFFETAAVTDDDAARTSQYQARAEAVALRKSAGTVEEFLTSLEMDVDIDGLHELNLTRAAQLIAKTNQWNLTGRRHTQNDVQSMATDPAWVAQVLRMRDRFADHGIVGVLLAEQQGTVLTIDTWLMSCRVIGRNLEQVMLGKLLDQARRRGCEAVTGTYLALPKNQQVADLYPRLGFEDTSTDAGTGTTTWSLAVGPRPDSEGPANDHEPPPTRPAATEPANLNRR